MRRSFFWLVALVLLPFAGLLPAQEFQPPPAQAPDPGKLKEIAERTERLGRRLLALRRQNVRDPYLAEVEIYHKAAEWIVHHNEFYQKEAADWTLEALDRGLLRAAQLAQGESPWLSQTGHAVVRAFRSRIDGSVQPYAVTFPADYGKDPRKKWRIDVVLHGRDASLTEVKFLHQFAGLQPAPAEQEWVQINIFGRGNNAYRWAGETDVIEAVDAFVTVERLLGREQLLDPSRVVLRGFSMGGAGTWHLGLHRPDRWCVLGPGAGFTTTHGYVKGLPNPLPDYQEACLRIYDAVEYAENAFNVPVVAYSGADDPQKQAADNIEKRLKQLGIPMTHLVAPGLGHRFPPEWQKKAEAEYAKHVARGRPEYPPRVRFVTYTLKYPSCFWVELIGLERHYQRAAVDASHGESGFTVQTANVRALRLDLPPGASRQPTAIKIDGQSLTARPYLSPAGTLHLYLERREGRWHMVLPEKVSTDLARRLQKVAGLQGPIDDAFVDSFLCVRGTGKAWHEATQQYAEANLARFREEWSKYLRGELPVKDDEEVTPEDIATRHLILFGDPSSNSLIDQVLSSLPLRWTREQITLAGVTVPAATHVPVLIYPSPLNPRRYVVLNSGHTFHAPEFRGTNALLFPRLGDYALLKRTPTTKDPLEVEVVTAGLFNDFWQAAK
ncbi:MAG TPA: prolyl oligopeptidase family serine peptidase [Gemmataceae bacterium]|nr:prolyl oligopeptidase family serine peptidase [Gemmataceae bacterium]